MDDGNVPLENNQRGELEIWTLYCICAKILSKSFDDNNCHLFIVCNCQLSIVYTQASARKLIETVLNYFYNENILIIMLSLEKSLLLHSLLTDKKCQ